LLKKFKGSIKRRIEMKRICLFVLLVSGLLLTACAPAVVATQAPAATVAPTEAPKPLKVAIIGAMTGTSASLGEWMKKAVTLAIEEKNAAGGIQGRKIDLLIYDDEADPTKSVNIAKKVVTEDGVIAAWATTNSTCVLADLPIFQEAKIPQFTWGTNVQITQKGSDYIFRSCPPGPAFENSLVDYLVSKGHTKFAIIGDNGAYGKGQAQYEIDALKRANLTPLVYEQHGADDKDFSGQLTKIIAAKPEVLLLASSEVAAGLIAKQARQLGFEGLMAGGQPMSTPKFIETAGCEAIEGMVFASGWPGTEANEQNKKFAAAYKARWGDEAETHVANAYDLMQVFFIAADKANPLTPENVAAEMHKVSGYVGLQGVLTITKEGESLASTLLGEIKNCKPVYFK
jgi:branched-chain amino acid transport system substrate-binding protein